MSLIHNDLTASAPLRLLGLAVVCPVLGAERTLNKSVLSSRSAVVRQRDERSPPWVLLAPVSVACGCRFMVLTCSRD
jgi:hypothetical protein